MKIKVKNGLIMPKNAVLWNRLEFTKSPLLLVLVVVVLVVILSGAKYANLMLFSQVIGYVAI